MIPKIIHYCWFGGKEKPILAQKCIESWRKFCPDYEIIEWNESNFALDYNVYVKEAYQSKKWAFVTDVVRLFALVNYGGIYMDTDVEVLRSLDPLLSFEALAGFELQTQLQTGLMACIREQELFKKFLEDYEGKHFIKEDGVLDLTTNVTRITNICLSYGLKLNNREQTIAGFTLLPKDYLCPKDVKTGKITITKNTYVIHHFDGSWIPKEKKYKQKLLRFLGPNVTKILVILKKNMLGS